jgi:hypothetical protein
MGLGAEQVEGQLVGVHLGQEVAAAREVFPDQRIRLLRGGARSPHRSDRRARRVGYGRAVVAERFGEVTPELIAMVGLPDEVAQRDAIAMQGVNAGSKDGVGRDTALLGESPGQQAAADFVCGVLDDRQAHPPDLCIAADWLKTRPLRFDVREVLLRRYLGRRFYSRRCWCQKRSSAL